MNMTLRNRIFSLVLALVMLISMLPMPAANAVPQQAPGVQVEKLPAIQVEKPSQDMGQTSTTAATITLVLKDSYGDGWNGNKIAVYIDSAFSGNYTISSGSSGSYTISYDSSKSYEFQWVKGSYASECSFEIKLGSEVKLAATKSMCGNYTNGQSLLTIEADNYNLEGEFAGGTGISADPYLVATKAQLDNVRNYPEAHFRQVKNITFVASDFSSSGDFYNNGQGWEPIDNFKGSYDGNGFSITGLTIVRDVTGSGHYIGLFAYTQGDIANVDMVDLSYTVTGSASWVYIGGVAAYGSDQEVIGCSASGTMNVAGSYVGGIVGYGNVVKYCTNHVDITISSGYADVGGIVGGAAEVGYCDNYGTISHGDDGRVGGIVGNAWTGVYNCTNSGSVTVDAPEEQYASIDVGGIVGYLTGYAKQCQNSGAVVASGDYVCVGGIAGYYYASSTAKVIAECVNHATVSTTAPSGSIVTYGYAGGIVGDVDTGYIYDCYVTKNVTITTRGTAVAYGGGIVGYFSSGTISRCYSLVNTVTVNTGASSWARGGLVGASWGTVSNCYYRYTWGVAGNNGTVYNVTQITTLSGYANQSNYTGFDFTNTWKMGTGDYTYAVLRMEDGHTHSMVYNAATVTQEASGNLEHWYCAGCDTYFSDAAGGLYTTQDMIASEPLPKTGICGDNVTWSLSHEGVLIISGTGAMADYAQETDRPWNGFKDDIVSIVVMDGVTHIGDNAFDSCQSVTDVVLSNSVTSIGKDGFSCCLKLDSIVLGNCVVTIDEGAFAGCGLKTLELPDTVTTIGDGAFELSAVEYLLIPENVTSIGDRAFAGENDRLICFTGDAPALGTDLFAGATGRVWYPVGNNTWTENVMQNYGGTVTWNAYDTLDDVSIHSADHYDYHWTLSIIGTLTVTNRYSTVSWNYSYSRRPDWEAYKDQITAIVLKNVENVGDYMFYGYANVKTVDFGIAEAIGSRAFYDCTSLETVFLQSFTEDCVIEDYAFYNCTALQQVAFPDETTMGSYAFGYCDQLTKIYITTYGTGRLDSSYSLSLSSDSFKGVTATVYMPVGWYMTDYGDFGGTLTWAQAEFGPCGNDAFWTYDAATSTVTITGTGAIASYHHGLSYPWYGLKENVKHVVFEDGVTYIPAYVFEYMDQIQTAILPNTLEILACNAFNDCMKLNNLIIPASVTQLTGNFNRCNALTDLYHMGTAEEWANLDGNSNVGGSYDYVQTVHFLVRTEQAATCTEPGVAAHYRFDDTSVYAGYYDLNRQPIDQPATIPATGHSYENGACSVCGAEQSVVIVAQGTCGDNLIWVLDESGKLTVSGTGDMDYYIFKVSVPWDDYRDSIYTVEIGEGVTGIGNVAFCDCVNLTNVTISNTVTSIGESAFYCCRKLKYIFIPATTTSIASNAFEMCILDHAFFIGPDIHYSVAQYSERYHADCFGDEMESGACSICNPPEGVIARGKCGDNLTWLLEENGTLTISGTGAMRNWSNGLQKWYSYRNQIKTVVIEEGVTTIGTDAFNDCENLTSVSIPNSMISICDYAFAYCENLIEVTIPDYVAELGDYAFTNCASLTNVVIGNGLTVMPSYLFLYCDALTTVTIGHNVTTIQGGAFYDCTNLNHVLYMGTEEQWNAISVGSDNSYLTNATRHNNCTGEEIVDGVCTICNPVNDYIAQGICGDNLTWTLDENGLLTISGTGAMTDFEDSSSMPWYAHKHNILSVVVENGVTNIGDFAFSNCTNLADVSLPDSVTKFGWLVFADCTGLTSVTIPDSVLYIGWYAFGGCTALTYVTIPAGLGTIPMQAFIDCSSLWHVLYKGTEEQWNAISIGSDNSYLTNATRHYNCTGDEIVDLENQICVLCCQHNGTETERQEPTCTEAGLVSYVCDLCGSSYTEELSALGHDYEALVVPPTCDEPGFTKHTCTRCGEFYFSDDTSATGHTFGEWYTVTAPTCVQEGQKRRDCLVCDGYQLEALATIDHNFVTYSVTQTPTTTTEGKLSAQCEGCVDVDIVTLPALNDSDYTYAVIAVPTTSAVGTGRYTWNITTYGTWYFDVEIPQLPMESQGQITVDTVTAAPGETVTVDVRFLNNPGFGGMIFEVHYDAAVLELVDYTKDLGEDICTDSGLKDANGMVRFVYVGTENVTGDGVLISLTFLVKETAEEGLTEICVELSEDTDDFFYYDGYDMIDFLPGTENGGIEIIEYTPGDANGDGKVNNRDAARILQYLAGWDVEVNLKAMDVNGDGKVNNRDAARILQYLAGWDVELN